MPRPHIDYLQSQTLPWQPSDWPHLPGCQRKVLSRDPDSGAVSALVRFPSGWAAPAAASLAATEELFVLDGGLEIDGRRCGQDCYGRFPAGWRHTARVAPDGAVALAFYDAEPVATRAAAPGRGGAEQALLIDAFELPWAEAGIEHVFGDARHQWKVLHGSPDRGPATLLLASPPHLHPAGWLAPQEIHSCAEELFVLSGDFLCTVGLMSSGAYAWRPAGVAHGPYGSRGGNLALLRTHGAPLATDYTAHERALEREPRYQPVLPPGLQAGALHPWRPQRY